MKPGTPHRALDSFHAYWAASPIREHSPIERISHKVSFMAGVVFVLAEVLGPDAEDQDKLAKVLAELSTEALRFIVDNDLTPRRQ